MKVGKYFNLSEFTWSASADRLKIDNTPTNQHLGHIILLVSEVLDPLRELVGPIQITSGYRGPKVNRAVGGSPTSQHVMGQAADIVVRGRTPANIIKVIREAGLPFDQVIDELNRSGSAWTHVSYGCRHRREALRARPNPSTGKMVYTRI